MRVEFARRRGGGSVATITRSDGVRLRLSSYDRKHAVPHDLAHFVTEQQLGMADGLFGSIAEGAVFDSLEVLAGRRAAVRSDAVRRRNAAGLALAEMLVGAVHLGLDGPDRAVVTSLARAWGSVRQGPCPYPEPARLAAIRELRRAGERFAALGPEEVLPLHWSGQPAGGRSGRPVRRS
ncbi:hypothetical protein [Pseudonocardia xishanensis]|uniref:IrrE N-terminal-like domain-containing protein n=1 Tax=Pseudonocardia xishanensis TaxID=630995 RepID=A0ABP8RWV2_9PSEU